MEECQLPELILNGGKFTWEKSRGTHAWVREKLDRGFATLNWWTKFPIHSLNVIRTSVSDHDPLLLELFKVDVRKRTFSFVLNICG